MIGEESLFKKSATKQMVTAPKKCFSVVLRETGSAREAQSSKLKAQGKDQAPSSKPAPSGLKPSDGWYSASQPLPGPNRPAQFEPIPCSRSTGVPPAHDAQRAGAVGEPVVFATPISGHRPHPAKRTLTLCGRPERAGRPRSNDMVPVEPWSLLLLSNRNPDLFAKAATHDPDISRCSAPDSAPLSLAPGFSRVLLGGRQENRFNGFFRSVRETAEAVVGRSLANTRLKPGANERAALPPAKHEPSVDAVLLFSRRQRSAVPPVQVLPLSFELYPWTFPPVHRG